MAQRFRDLKRVKKSVAHVELQGEKVSKAMLTQPVAEALGTHSSSDALEILERSSTDRNDATVVPKSSVPITADPSDKVESSSEERLRRKRLTRERPLLRKRRQLNPRVLQYSDCAESSPTPVTRLSLHSKSAKAAGVSPTVNPRVSSRPETSEHSGAYPYSRFHEIQDQVEFSLANTSVMDGQARKVLEDIKSSLLSKQKVTSFCWCERLVEDSHGLVDGPYASGPAGKRTEAKRSVCNLRVGRPTTGSEGSCLGAYD